MGPNVPEQFIQNKRRQSQNQNPHAEDDQDDQSRRRGVSVFDDFTHFFQKNDKFSLILVSFTTINHKTDSFKTLDFLSRVGVSVEYYTERSHFC